MKFIMKTILQEFYRTHEEIERITREKADSEKKHDEFLKTQRESSEANRNIQRIREIIRSK